MPAPAPGVGPSASDGDPTSALGTSLSTAPSLTKVPSLTKPSSLTKGHTGTSSADTAGNAADPEVAEPRADSLDAQPTEPASRQPSAAEGGRRAPLWLAAALAALVLALACLDGWLLISQPTSGSRTERDQALSTAKSAVPLILSYDHRRFDADVAAAKGRLTGRAVTDYVQAMTTTIKPTATKVQAVVRAQTDGAGVEAVSSDGSQVTVVVFGEQKVTNTALKAPRTDLFRVRVTLDRVQGQWLVSKFDQI